MKEPTFYPCGNAKAVCQPHRAFSKVFQQTHTPHIYICIESSLAETSSEVIPHPGLGRQFSSTWLMVCKALEMLLCANVHAFLQGYFIFPKGKPTNLGDRLSAGTHRTGVMSQLCYRVKVMRGSR